MNFKLLLYKYRFFFLYIVFGTISLVSEILIYSFIKDKFNNLFVSSIIGLAIGILISFWLNIRYNFKISQSKRNRALKYFILISFFSYLIQISFINYLQKYLAYEYSRLIISGSLFWIAYLFHKKFSFKDYKKVGIAIYANGVENLDIIYNKVNNFPDFIHVDIIDETFNENHKKVLAYKSEVIRAHWKNKFIEAHIMSKYPKKWINKISSYVNRIYVHLDINENIYELHEMVKHSKCEFGIVIQNQSQLNQINKYIEIVDSILVLSIDKAGHSGQKFDFESLKIIDKLNSHNFRSKFSLNVDGGINSEIIKLIKADYVVSGSYVLSSNSPEKAIMILQTSSQYESY